MSTHDATTSVTHAASVRRGILTGAVPLLVAVISVGLTLGSILLTRWAMEGQEYVAQEQAEVIVAIIGLVLTAIVFALASVRTLMRVRDWLRTGLSQPAAAALWTLAATALVILLPLLLAVFFPQHPAPPRPPDPALSGLSTSIGCRIAV